MFNNGNDNSTLSIYFNIRKAASGGGGNAGDLFAEGSAVAEPTQKHSEASRQAKPSGNARTRSAYRSAESPAAVAVTARVFKNGRQYYKQTKQLMPSVYIKVNKIF
ncbi:conserved hypothetical protein [Trichinella spiralis]|uniref:hypothetical protein n=1 Tax=Trichinella spiralis TaxID=6334 RepID=UPI0001EFB3E3|nr:conserved hypothetical protein [Trichinella spiralis]